MEAEADSPVLGYSHLGIVAGGRGLREKEARRIGLPVTLGLMASGDDEVAIWKTCLRLISLLVPRNSNASAVPRKRGFALVLLDEAQFDRGARISQLP